MFIYKNMKYGLLLILLIKLNLSSNGLDVEMSDGFTVGVGGI